MDKGEQNVIELVNRWAAYSAVTPDATLAGFCLHFLTNQLHESATNGAIPTVDDDKIHNDQWKESLSDTVHQPMISIRPEARLAALVGRLSKYAYFYSKKAMQSLDVKGMDDPVYLLVVLQMGTPKKSEVIYEMMAEFASGTDIINRHIRMEYLEEFPDEQDRRSKRLRLTPKGLATIQECFPIMNQVADVAFGSLTDGEKAILVQILDKLDRYHTDHYKQSRNSEFNEVYERMVG
ncbi:MarR family transcriptional regulator [Spirosoma sp.]|uniref:MarR family winged helix-turn-helix transcriptional regulator n=1 Tax=Spirosoma sp. TaxID=1899569 RepID=UPI0026180563|nr:MarR family transcriptional regulator [Spirosoma sp.]MCX6214349.1 MarR family transcriptional regulator [Spirosoma sp.]